MDIVYSSKFGREYKKLTQHIKDTKSEQTIIKHGFNYKGIKYINDMGHPCEYRLEQDGQDLKIMVKYYRGTLLSEYKIK